MELADVKSMWQAYDSKLEKSLKLNLHCLEQIQTQKVKSQLAPLFWQRIIEILFHMTAIVLLVAFLFNNFYQFPYAISAVGLLVFYVLAIVMCLKQIFIIKGMDYSSDIVGIQSSLVMLQTHSVNYMRLAVLCIPTFLAYPLVVSKAIGDLGLTGLGFLDIGSNFHSEWWRVEVIVFFVLTPLCILFYKYVSYKNIHIDWVKKTIQRTSGARIAKAIEFVKELDTLKHGVI